MPWAAAIEQQHAPTHIAHAPARQRHQRLDEAVQLVGAHRGRGALGPAAPSRVVVEQPAQPGGAATNPRSAQRGVQSTRAGSRRGKARAGGACQAARACRWGTQSCACPATPPGTPRRSCGRRAPSSASPPAAPAAGFGVGGALAGKKGQEGVQEATNGDCCCCGGTTSAPSAGSRHVFHLADGAHRRRVVQVRQVVPRSACSSSSAATRRRSSRRHRLGRCGQLWRGRRGRGRALQVRLGAGLGALGALLGLRGRKANGKCKYQQDAAVDCCSLGACNPLCSQPPAPTWPPAPCRRLVGDASSRSMVSGCAPAAPAAAAPGPRWRAPGEGSGESPVRSTTSGSGAGTGCGGGAMKKRAAADSRCPAGGGGGAAAGWAAGGCAPACTAAAPPAGCAAGAAAPGCGAEPCWEATWAS